jgi:amino acid adenylation domain-containing protein
MLEDSQTTVVVAEKRTRGQLPDDCRKVLWLDDEWEQIAAEPDSNPECRSSGESLAYVMYTSGSTGVPKGVEIVHRGIVRLLFGQDFAQFGDKEVILQAAPVSFDASTFEIWGALLHGAKCVLYPGRVVTARELHEAIKKYQVTTLWLTSSLFNAVVDEEPEALAPLRQLLTGGEALSVSHVRRARERLSDVELINGYGPTEATTFACTFRIPRQLDAGTSTIPIGRPIANTRVYVLDGQGEPVPVGTTGELYIGGDGVGRGYLNRPELTAERFVEDRFSGEAGARLYRTGDLVRYRADGNLEFLGRADQQVKIRGFRIELEEIEAVLRKHPEVREAAVLAREDSSQEKRLVAYLIARGHELETSELRAWVKDSLPEYMAPSAFVYLERLPLNANGKVDKQALPAPEQRRPELNEPFAAAESEMEQVIAGIWQAALGLPEVGKYDNFFDLGGHSLLVAQIHAKLEKAVGRRVAIVDVFRHPTISTLAKHLSEVEPQDRSFDEVHARAHQQKLALAQRGEALRSRRTNE